MTTDIGKSKVGGGRVRALQGRHAITLLALGLALLLAACGQGEAKMKKETVLNVVVYSSLDRPIYDIIFNGADLGVANKYGGTGTITGVSIPFGIQTLRWNVDGPEGTEGNGKPVQIKNKLTISPEQVPEGTRYLGLHIYPDDTAEVTFDEFIPERTERGKTIRSSWKDSIAKNLSTSSKNEGGKK